MIQNRAASLLQEIDQKEKELHALYSKLGDLAEEGKASLSGRQDAFPITTVEPGLLPPGPEDRAGLGDRIMAFVRTKGGNVGRAEVKSHLNASNSGTDAALKSLVLQGKLRKVKRGTYRVKG